MGINLGSINVVSETGGKKRKAVMISWEGFLEGGLTVDGGFDSTQPSILIPRNQPRIPQAAPAPSPQQFPKWKFVPPYPDT